MLANFFSKSKPINYIVVVALFFITFMMVSFRLFSKDISLVSFLFSKLILLVEFLFLFVLFVFVSTKNKLIFEHSYAFLFFILLFGLFPKTIASSSLFSIHLILFLFYRKLYSLRKNTSLFRKLFDAGFWLGIAFILTSHTVVFLALLYVGIFIYQKLTVQTLLIPIIGFITPLFLYFTYCFWMDEVASFYSLFDFKIPSEVNYYIESGSFYPLLMVLFFTVIAVFLKSPKAFSISNSFKKSWALLLVHFLISLLYVFTIDDKNEMAIIELFFPIAIIMANGMESIRNKWIKEGVLWLFVSVFFIVAWL